MFKVEGLTYTYRNWRTRVLGHKATKALTDLTFEIPEGSVTAVLGMSGSGKSTLLNVLGIMLDVKQPRWKWLRWLWCCPIEGDVTYHPQAAKVQLYRYKTLSLAAQNECRSHRFGFVLQSSFLLPNFPCRYNVELPLLIQKKPTLERHAALDRLLTALRHTRNDEARELLDVLEKKPSSVSTGQRQRMAILRALIHDPEVVFADEPCASLDPVNKRRVNNLLLSWQRGEFAATAAERSKRRTLILVSHDISSACQDAEYFLLLYEGRLLGRRQWHRSKLPGAGDEVDELIVEKALETGDATLLSTSKEADALEDAISHEN